MRDLKFDGFYRYDEMSAFLEEAQEKYQSLMELKTLTKTSEGRNVFLVEITNNDTGAAEDKGAYYVQAGVHAVEAAGTTAALHLINSLLTEKKYTELLKKVAFYIIPMANPDGTEYALTTCSDIRSSFEKIRKKNGLIPMDINDDGLILTMRWEDPAGSMKEDEIDARLMVKRKPGDTKGPFYYIAEEGLIQDYDGTGITSGVRKIDFNRNWPINWKPDRNSSYYPFSEPEIRAIGDFFVHHPNIFAGIDFHCGCQAVLRPTMKPDFEMDQDDLELILNIGKKAEKITHFPLIHEREYKEPWRTPLMLTGNSNDWAYSMMGISHYVIELGNGFNTVGITTAEYMNADNETRETDFMRRILAFYDSQKKSIFVSWKKFKHPQLGMMEIGGLLRGHAYFMYPPVMEKIAPRTTEFAAYHAGMHPELLLSDVDVTLVEKNIYRIRAAVTNIGGFSTNVMKSGGSNDIKKAVCVRLVPSARMELLSYSWMYEFDSLEVLEGSKKMEWFVKAGVKRDIIIEASHPKCGIFRKSIVLGEEE